MDSYRKAMSQVIDDIESDIYSIFTDAEGIEKDIENGIAKEDFRIIEDAQGSFSDLIDRLKNVKEMLY